MECGDLSPLSFWRRGHSGDKSPHSKRAVIAHLHLIKKRHLKRVALPITPALRGRVRLQGAHDRMTGLSGTSALCESRLLRWILLIPLSTCSTRKPIRWEWFLTHTTWSGLRWGVSHGAAPGGSAIATWRSKTATA